ncbi:hypothetical protein CHS0354_018310 [Potamilus streckersoni]|uniref:TNFR-Cys domain-containing protein n=1 Tax=Potamilus streckersoni TaxID=2493646 RepID=A0AAE0TJN6_9BIVA|nr:hypothetical protein CHS0354_018310 [Potamilus streckersoni]
MLSVKVTSAYFIFGFLLPFLECFADCPIGSYTEKSTGLCITCSKCVDNQIVREQCTRAKDTVCGPFKEFNTFVQSDRLNGNTYSKKALTIIQRLKSRKSISSVHNENNEVIKADDYVWYHVTILLIALLCFTCIVIVVLVIVAYRTYRRSRGIAINTGEESSEEDRIGLAKSEDYVT